MAKIISLASSKVKAIQNGYLITDEEYVQALEADTDSIIGGVSVGQDLLILTDEREEIRKVTGVHTFQDMPVLWSADEGDDEEEDDQQS